jgi:UDP-N-acetylmuramate dehydrogenase
MPLSLPKELKLDVKSQAKLEQYTTFRLGGPCRALISCQTPQELESAVKHLVAEKLPFVLIGGGSNLVVSDEGLDCFVVRYVSDKPIIQRQDNDVIVSGSTNLDSLALYTANQGLEGLIYASGIPGTVGGAVVGNAGAFGKQVGDVLKSVIVISRSGQKKELKQADIGFTYRNSNLKESGDIVVEVRFSLRSGDKEALFKEREEILKVRHEKHPDLNTYPCAGSFFRNIEPTSKAERRQATGWFLEQAGGKNLRVGGAFIFDKHANIIVKGPHCTAQNVHDLSVEMAKLAKKAFNLDLVREVRFVGKIGSNHPHGGEWFW